MVTVTMSQGSSSQPRPVQPPRRSAGTSQGNHEENTHCHSLKTFSFLESHGCLKNALPVCRRAFWWYSENCMCSLSCREQTVFLGTFLLVSRTKREKLLLSWVCGWVKRSEKRCNYLSLKLADVVNWTRFTTPLSLLPVKHKFKSKQNF